jgi:hypothetical protein
MNVNLKYTGYIPCLDKYQYFVLCDNGHIDLTNEDNYLGKEVTIDMDIKLWNGSSGWVEICCDNCNETRYVRAYPGQDNACLCGCIEHIPDNAILLDSHIGG